ncbi:NUDIX domain-containing protein [Candidatus Chlorohelix sp.]|uniref:NUDIX domain-containing protein n=1 Tax=Candidatus Chlorohelix sp. TaxID=3139201 RepID=UPI00305D5C84
MCATSLETMLSFGVTRPTCPMCGYIVFQDPKVVVVALVEYGGKVLLGKRNINPCLGKWSFLSGYVERCEKVEEAALREVKEETNLDVTLTALLGVYSDNNNPIILIVYRAEVVSSILDMTPQLDEVSELAFFSLNELPELAFPFDSKILRHFVTGDRQIALD